MHKRQALRSIVIPVAPVEEAAAHTSRIGKVSPRKVSPRIKKTTPTSFERHLRFTQTVVENFDRMHMEKNDPNRKTLNNFKVQ